MSHRKSFGSCGGWRTFIDGSRGLVASVRRGSLAQSAAVSAPPNKLKSSIERDGESQGAAGPAAVHNLGVQQK